MVTHIDPADIAEAEYDDLHHLCKLATVAAGLFQSDSQRDEWIEYVRDADDRDLGDHFQCLSILSKAFIALSKRTGMSPTFRIPTRLPDEFNPNTGEIA